MNGDVVYSGKKFTGVFEETIASIFQDTVTHSP